MPAWWLPSAIQSATAVGQYVIGRKKRIPYPLFEDTELGKLLKKRQTEGMYPESVKRKIIGEVGRETGNVAQQEKTQIRGLLERTGMGRSIAGIGLMARPERERMRRVGEIARQVAIENELSKSTAGEEFARGKTEMDINRMLSEYQTKAENRMALGQMVGGLAGAGLGAVQRKELSNIIKDPEASEELKAYAQAELAGMKLPYGFLSFQAGAGERTEESNQRRATQIWGQYNQLKLEGRDEEAEELLKKEFAFLNSYLQ